MIDVLVVDDEPMARARLRRLVKAQPDLRLLGECASSVEALDAIRAKRPDVVFLDIDMPGMNGFDMISRVPEAERPLIVFVTAYEEFALGAFDLSAIDYLLKPFDPDRFATTLERIRARLREGATAPADAAPAGLPSLAALLDSLRAREREPVPERLVVRAGSELVFVPVRDIDWISAADNYVELHVGAETYLLRETLASVERRLEPAAFVRIRRDAIVNLARVRAVRTGNGQDADLVLRNGHILRLGRAYRSRVTERWQGA